MERRKFFKRLGLLGLAAVMPKFLLGKGEKKEPECLLLDQPNEIEYYDVEKDRRNAIITGTKKTVFKKKRFWKFSDDGSVQWYDEVENWEFGKIRSRELHHSNDSLNYANNVEHDGKKYVIAGNLKDGAINTNKFDW